MSCEESGDVKIVFFFCCSSKQEIPRKEKLIVEKLRKQPLQPGPVGYGPYTSIADPKRELAESLPLCHPNEDYLKDFTPMQGTRTRSAFGKFFMVAFNFIL